MLPKNKIELFKKRVVNGQSLKMLKWEFKLKDDQIKTLCKEYNLILNTVDYLNYSYKLSKSYQKRE
jgi:hypothetical protein